jgi:hypothetical protein
LTKLRARDWNGIKMGRAYERPASRQAPDILANHPELKLSTCSSHLSQFVWSERERREILSVGDSGVTELNGPVTHFYKVF